MTSSVCCGKLGASRHRFVWAHGNTVPEGIQPFLAMEVNVQKHIKRRC